MDVPLLHVCASLRLPLPPSRSLFLSNSLPQLTTLPSLCQTTHTPRRLFFLLPNPHHFPYRWLSSVPAKCETLASGGHLFFVKFTVASGDFARLDRLVSHCLCWNVPRIEEEKEWRKKVGDRERKGEGRKMLRGVHREQLNKSVDFCNAA